MNGLPNSFVFDDPVQIAPEQHYALGTLLEQRKDLQGALDAFQMEIKVNPKHPDVQHKVAELKRSNQLR